MISKSPPKVVLPLAKPGRGLIGAAQLSIDPDRTSGAPLPWAPYGGDNVRAAWRAITEAAWPLQSSEEVRWRDQDQAAYGKEKGSSANLPVLVLMLLACTRQRGALGRFTEVWATGLISKDGQLDKINAEALKVQGFIDQAAHPDAVFLLPAVHEHSLDGLNIERRPFGPDLGCFGPSERPLVVLVERGDLRRLARAVMGGPRNKHSRLPLAAVLLLAVSYGAWQASKPTPVRRSSAQVSVKEVAADRLGPVPATVPVPPVPPVDNAVIPAPKRPRRRRTKRAPINETPDSGTFTLKVSWGGKTPNEVIILDGETVLERKRPPKNDALSLVFDSGSVQGWLRAKPSLKQVTVRAVSPTKNPYVDKAVPIAGAGLIWITQEQ